MDTTLISKNVAPVGTARIGLYDAKGNRIGQMPLGRLKPPNHTKKLYSFGAISDVHIGYNTADTDFRTALDYLHNTAKVDFTCICGDLTAGGTDEQLTLYKSIAEQYKVEAVSGNHDSYVNPVTSEMIMPYTGRPLYYSFEHKGDVFIMCGMWKEWREYQFIDGELQWLYETLEANRNKRCFVFYHIFPWGDSGNANGYYPTNIFTGTQGSVFQSLMAHYKNVVLFHGHSHLKFYLQEIDDKANYSEALGFRSIHIPSISVPRDMIGDNLSYIFAESEGYVIDVHENGIHLRGRDFIKEEFLPIASYWIDTKLVEVEAGTYTDSTGTITT